MAATPQQNATPDQTTHMYMADLQVPTDVILVGAWDAGFFSCFDFCIPNCIMSACCPWVAIAQITSRLGLHRYSTTLLTVFGIHVAMSVCFVTGSMNRQQGDSKEMERAATHSRLVLWSHGSVLTWRGAATVWCLVGVLWSMVYVVVVWRLRLKVRDRFQIGGSWWQDLIAAWCCSCCTIAQIATHVKSYKPGSCGFDAPQDLLPAYPL